MSEREPDPIADADLWDRYERMVYGKIGNTFNVEYAQREREWWAWLQEQAVQQQAEEIATLRAQVTRLADLTQDQPKALVLYSSEDGAHSEVLAKIMRVLFPDATCILDPTYGNGGFYSDHRRRLRRPAGQERSSGLQTPSLFGSER